ncbi:MAG: NAD(P)/FAD-dependent oxidoreductase [Mycoplasmataceae bacterium]|jgi:thioredoxin reductase (NADPH)|nr:NAD(P)/FAD-dependent oxidoreductase [Mycoplasmataceae bacterium]
MNKINFDEVFDVVIIGGGPVGIYGAYLAHIKGLKAILVEANAYLGGQPVILYPQKSIHDYPMFHDIKAHDLVQHLINNLQVSNTPTLLETKILSVTYTDNYYTCTTNTNAIKAHNIIIATGAGMFTPNLLQIPGVSHTNTQYTIDEIEKYKDKRVVILGGGDSAVDWANEFKKQQITEHVTLIHRRDQFRANGVNVDNLQKHKVNVILNSAPVEIKGKELIIKNLLTNVEDKIDFDIIIVQYGQTIDVHGLNIFENLKLDETNKIIVDQAQKTNIPHIYAAGNSCNYTNRPGTIITGHGEVAIAINCIVNEKKDK